MKRLFWFCILLLSSMILQAQNITLTIENPEQTVFIIRTDNGSEFISPARVHLPEGTSSVEVLQNRLFGPTVIGEYDLSGASSITIEIKEPGLLPEEERFFRELDSYLERYSGNRRYYYEVKEKLKITLVLLSDLEQTVFREKRGGYQAMLENMDELKGNRGLNRMRHQVGLACSMYTSPSPDMTEYGSYVPPGESGGIAELLYRYSPIRDLPFFIDGTVYFCGIGYNQSYQDTSALPEISYNNYTEHHMGLGLSAGVGIQPFIGRFLYFIADVRFGINWLFINNTENSESTTDTLPPTGEIRTKAGLGFFMGGKFGLELGLFYSWATTETLPLSKGGANMAFVYFLTDERRTR